MPNISTEQDTDSLDKSLEEIMYEVYHISLDIAYETVTEDGYYHTVRKDLRPIGMELSEGFEDEVWSWADGLYHKYYHRMVSCRTSIQNIIDFDLGDFERYVAEILELFKRISYKLGKPRVISNEERKNEKS